MAANTHMSLASWNLALDSSLNVLNAGFVEIFSGIQPATPDTALSGNTLLATLNLSATAFAAASAGSKTANAIASASAAATGVATWFRAYKSDGTTAVIDGSAGVAASDMTLNSVAISSGATVSCSSWVVSCPLGQ